MKRAVLWGVLAVTYGLASAQVYEFSKPNVPVNDDSLGRHQHYPGSAGMYSLVVRGDTLYATWNDNRDGNFKIYFSKSTNGGSNWSSNVVVNDTAGASRFYSSIAVGRNGYLYACWQDDREQGGTYRVYCARSTDGGITWGRNVKVSQSIGLRPNIIVDRNDRVLVSYGAGVAYLGQSSNGGDTFTVYSVTDTGFQVLNGYPSLGIDDSGLTYFAFASPPPGGGQGFIWFTKAMDSADTSFLPSRIVSDTPTPYWGSHPSLITKLNGNTYIVYEATEANTQDIYLVKSTDRGQTFSSRIRVNDVRPPGLYAVNPSIAVDSGAGVFVSWSDDRSGEYHGYFAVSTNGGDSFGPSVIIEDTSISPSAYRTYQNLALDPISKEAYVIWADERLAPRAAWDIYSARGTLRSGVGELTSLALSASRSDLRIQPNPFSSFASVPGHVAERFSLYDISGRKVGVYKGDRIGWDVSPGVYFLRPDTRNLLPDARILRIVKLR